MRVALFAAAAALLVSGTALAGDIETLDTIAGWDIIIDKSVDFGCAMQAEFQGGALVRMGFNPSDGNGYMMVFKESWNDIVAGQGYDIGMNVDGQSWVGAAEGFRLGGMPGVYIPFDDPNFFVAVMKKYTMTLQHQGRDTITVSLDGTFNALQGVMACQQGVEQAR